MGRSVQESRQRERRQMWERQRERKDMEEIGRGGERIRKGLEERAEDSQCKLKGVVLQADGWAPLHTAAMRGSAAEVKRLLGAGQDKDSTTVRKSLTLESG